MNKPPAFQFYASDFLAGTTLMTNEEVGIYVRALCHQWESGGLSDLHLERLGLGLGFSGFPQIKAKFNLDSADGLWKNPRLESVRACQIEYRQKQAENGSKGGRPKGLANPSLTQGLSQTEPKKSSPTPSPSPTPNKSVETSFAHAPSLAEIKAFAKVQGISESSAVRFWEHHEGNALWQNKYGIAIKWQTKLGSWAAKDRETPPASNGAQRGPFYKETPSEADLLVRKFKREGLIP